MWEMINKITGKINDKTCVIDHLKVNNIKYSHRKRISQTNLRNISLVWEKFLH